MARNFGFEPDSSDYYFVSYYSESDSRVAPIARLLHEGGVRLWYDRGLRGAKKWKTQIAERIRKCNAMVLFITKKLLYSKDSYVLIEFELAKLRDKEVYVVFLDTDIDRGRINDCFATFYTEVLELHGVWTAPGEDNLSIAKRIADILHMPFGVKPKPPIFRDETTPKPVRAVTPAKKKASHVDKPQAGGKRGAKVAAAVLCLLVVLVAAVGLAGYFRQQEVLQVQQEEVDSQFAFRRAGDGYKITAYRGGLGDDLVLPSTYKGMPVVSIGDSAFYDCASLTSVTIPDSVTSIGDSAFYRCTNLTSITIPDSVTSIGAYAFTYCSSLTSITIPHGVTSIRNSIFYYCTSLTSVIIPDSVTSIGNSVFYYCTSLSSITIPDSVTRIGDYVFYYCTSLTSITIPDNVTSIGGRAFYYCTSLTSITIPDSVTSIGEWALFCCTSLTSVTIPDSVKSIGFGAFYSCNITVTAPHEASYYNVFPTGVGVTWIVK